MSMTASRLWRFFFGPVSSTKTTRIEKSLLAGHRENTASAIHVRDAAAFAASVRILLTGDLLAVRGVPQTELRGDAPAS